MAFSSGYSFGGEALEEDGVMPRVRLMAWVTISSALGLSGMDAMRAVLNLATASRREDAMDV